MNRFERALDELEGNFICDKCWIACVPDWRYLRTGAILRCPDCGRPMRQFIHDPHTGRLTISTRAINPIQVHENRIAAELRMIELDYAARMAASRCIGTVD